MTLLEQTQLDCEERARRIEQQWRELPALFAVWSKEQNYRSLTSQHRASPAGCNPSTP